MPRTRSQKTTSRTAEEGKAMRERRTRRTGGGQDLESAMASIEAENAALLAIVEHQNKMINEQTDALEKISLTRSIGLTWDMSVEELPHPDIEEVQGGLSILSRQTLLGLVIHQRNRIAQLRAAATERDEAKERLKQRARDRARKAKEKKIETSSEDGSGDEKGKSDMTKSRSPLSSANEEKKRKGAETGKTSKTAHCATGKIGRENEPQAKKAIHPLATMFKDDEKT